MGKLGTCAKGSFEERRNALFQGEIVFLRSSVDRRSSEEL